MPISPLFRNPAESTPARRRSLSILSRLIAARIVLVAAAAAPAQPALSPDRDEIPARIAPDPKW